MDIYTFIFSIFTLKKERAAAGLCLPTHLLRCSRVSSLCSRHAGWILRLAACLPLGGALLPALLPLCTALHCSWGKVNTEASTSPSLLVDAEITFPVVQTQVGYKWSSVQDCGLPPSLPSFFLRSRWDGPYLRRVSVQQENGTERFCLVTYLWNNHIWNTPTDRNSSTLSVWLWSGIKAIFPIDKIDTALCCCAHCAACCAIMQYHSKTNLKPTKKQERFVQLTFNANPKTS